MTLRRGKSLIQTIDRSNRKSQIENLKSRVADGTRTRNNQNHNLELYH